MSVNANECLAQGRPSLLSLFWIFLKIGSTAFGGFMALISVVQNYLVNRKKLLSDEEMLDGISLATILPGPVAVNVVAYAGYKIRGISGAIVCAVAVILPSFFLILFLSYAYFSWGDMPAVDSVFKGFLPAVAAVIVATVINMGKKSLTGFKETTIAAIAVAVLVLIGGFFSTLAIILCAGLAGLLLFKNHKDVVQVDNIKASPKEEKSHLKQFPILILAFIAVCALLLTAPYIISSSTFMAAKLLATFSGMSLLLFGGGFVFIPLMQESVVETYHWITHQEFIDAIAMGQITPGPILISATFIGYKVAGVFGAATATIGIFTPPAMLMLVCTHYLQLLKESIYLKAILKGIRCAVIGMILAAAYFVAMSSEINVVTSGIFILSMIALLKFKLEVVWIIPASGLIGLIAFS
ncbi:MAG: chromate efflux transporter [Gammaproteobacteria bacterium]|nr:chromate efflux transporter [Gammaproteobacteria bacterium]